MEYNHGYNKIFEEKKLLSDVKLLDSPSKTSDNKRIDIQGLRGLAIIYVICFHLYPATFRNGFLGVDVFFVLSGFLIAMILNRAEVTVSSTKNFFSKRIKRIFPAYYLMLAAVITTGPPFLIFVDNFRLFIDACSSIFFINNIVEFFTKGDYFEAIANARFLLHAWSLSVEIQFYILAPLLVCIYQKVSFGKILLIILGFTSLTFHLITDGELSFSCTFSRLWQFLIGFYAYKVSSSNNRINVTRYAEENGNRLSIWSILVTSISLIVISPLIFVLDVPEKVYRVAITLATGTLIMGKWREFSDKFIAQEALVFIGNISYSVYLVHWPVIVFIKYMNDKRTLSSTEAFDAMVIISIISLLSYQKVEQYFIRSRLCHTVIFIITMTTLMIICTVINATTFIGTIKNINMTNNYVEKIPGELRLREKGPFNISESLLDKAIAHNRELLKPSSIIDPSISGFIRQLPNNPMNYSGFQTGNGPTKVMIVGNSVASDLFYSIEKAFSFMRYREITLLAESNCMPFQFKNSRSHKCDEFMENALRTIQSIKPDILYVIFKSEKPITNPFLGNIEDDVILSDMQHTIEQFSINAKRIIILYDLPWVSNNSNHIRAFVSNLVEKKPIGNSGSFKFDKYWKKYKYASERLNALACAQCERLFPHQLFCSPEYEWCDLYDPKNLLLYFRINGRLSQYGTEYITKLFKDQVDEYYARKYLI